MKKTKLAFSTRSFLNHLSSSEWDNKWVAARVQAPHRYLKNQPYYVCGQLDISDGGDTVSMYVDFKSQEEAAQALESLVTLSKTLNTFITKIQDSAKKLTELNANVEDTDEEC